MRKLLSSIASIAALLLVLGVATYAQADDDHKKPRRFRDNRDGTVTDNRTGLLWEKKTGSVGAEIVCIIPTDCADPTNVSNRYTWSSSAAADADGSIFTDFLTKMNCTISLNGTCGPGAYTDWRIPTLAELQTIFDCSFTPCIDPIFGPTKPAHYWSSTTNASLPVVAYHVNFSAVTDVPGGADKQTSDFVRAVRGGR